METDPSMSRSGIELRRLVLGRSADALIDRQRSVDPQMADWVDDFLFGQVWARGELTYDERMLLAVSSLASMGRVELMKNYLHGALQAGISPRKLREAIVQTVIYSGFPNAFMALQGWSEVVQSEAREGTQSSNEEPGSSGSKS